MLILSTKYYIYVTKYGEEEDERSLNEFSLWLHFNKMRNIDEATAIKMNKLNSHVRKRGYYIQ